ncbi:MAG: metalloregulator ArsR/SmtB family transcription factor [Acidobacteriota bacterium]
MASILKSLRLLAEPSRIRIVLLLEREELSVAELQEILGMGQSTISTYLSQLKQAALVEDRRTGKNILYSLKVGAPKEMLAVLRDAIAEIPEAAEDAEALQLILARRQDKMRSYFDELAGKFGRQYVPGRSWQGLAETLLMLMPPLVVADLGAGEGTVSQLLARRAKRVIVLDLLKHHFEEARAMYADLWLGFTKVELQRYLKDAGFSNTTLAVVHRETEAPHFETVLAAGDK